VSASADTFRAICDSLRGCAVIETQKFESHEGITILGWLLVDGRFLIIRRKGRSFDSFDHYENGDFNAVLEAFVAKETCVNRDLFESAD